MTRTAIPEAPIRCPCCGAQTGKQRISGFFAGNKRRILEALEGRPEGVPLSRLVDAVYGSRPDGGPLSAKTTLKVVVHQIRQDLAPMGWVIPSAKTGGYRLEPIEVSQ